MDFFDLSKKFERIYFDGGEVDGAVSSQQSCHVENFPERSKKGCDYATEYKKEMLKMKNLSNMNNQADNTETGVQDLDSTSIGTVTNINDLNNEVMHKIHKEYYVNKERPLSDLIINNYKKKILSLVETNEVTIITGPTGCGKTTQVPQFILDSCVEKNKYCNIVVTQPRRIAAISIAKRVCEERGWEVGTLCGYKVGLKDSSSPDTRLTYMTAGVLLQYLVNQKNLNSFTHIILDEIHERDQTTDFCLIVIKKLLNSIAHNVKVLLMSATVEASKFSEYFQKHYLGGIINAPILKIPNGTNYAVQIHYLDELSALGVLPQKSDTEPRISDLVFDICIRLIKQFERIDNDGDKKNSVLIFLPGIYEIEYLYAKLTDMKIHSAGAVQYKWAPLPLHSSITVEEQALVFQPPPSGYRKIILSTNIAESSITVPGVKFVIDFCLTKCLRTDTFSNFTNLQLCWASQTNCIQRAGRVGRVMEGRVYRMVFKSFYESLDKEPVPEMLTSPLEKVVLHSKLLDMGEPMSVLALALDPPDLSSIEWSILVLKELGGLLRTRKGVLTPLDGDLTFLGRLMAILPVDIYVTRLIIMGHLFGCLEECIVMGAAMSLKSVFNHPFKAKLKAYNSKLAWADGSCSDCIAFLNVYDVWCKNHENGYFKRSKGDNEVSWAKRHFIQLRVLKEVKLLVEELRMRLKDHCVEEAVGPGKVQWNDFQKALVLKIAIAGACYPNYFGRGKQGGVVNEKNAVKTLGGRNPFTTVYLNNFPRDQPLQLYSRLIKDELSECNAEMKVSSDNCSKVYIEFRSNSLKHDSEDIPFDGTLPGKIPMPIYRAVKIRQIQRAIHIKLLPIEEAKKRAKEQGIEYRKSILQQDPETEADEIVYKSLPGEDVSFISIIITHVIDPGQFWAQDSANLDNLRRIFNTLNFGKHKYKKFDSPPSVGDMCVAPYEENGEKLLYRARVESVSRQGYKCTVQVFFIDYGNSSVCDIKDLMVFDKKLKEILGRIPGLAFECKLCEIKPSVHMNSKGKWSKEAQLAFNRIISSGTLFAKVYSVVNGVVAIELFKMNEQNYQNSINKLLISEGFAEENEENYLSRVNNEARKERQLNLDGAHLHSSKVTEAFWNFNTFEPPEQKDCKISVELKGPYSPLEMRIYPYIRSALNMVPHIADDSVNSVLLDGDPQDSHEILIVAGFVNQNATGSRLALNNTTIMPNIHGLAALIPLIFAPEIEIRVDPERNRYTGILCGLGSDHDKQALFPEHDFEVYFDCEMTFDDFSTINSLRYFMSLMLMADENEPYPNLCYSEIIKFQKRIKTNLLRLVNKKRKSKDVEIFWPEHKWGAVENVDLFDNPVAQRHLKVAASMDCCTREAKKNCISTGGLRRKR